MFHWKLWRVMETSCTGHPKLWKVDYTMPALETTRQLTCMQWDWSYGNFSPSPSRDGMRMPKRRRKSYISSHFLNFSLLNPPFRTSISWLASRISDQVSHLMFIPLQTRWANLNSVILENWQFFTSSLHLSKDISWFIIYPQLQSTCWITTQEGMISHILPP